MDINIYNFFERPILLLSTQKKLECHREDSQGSRACPIYVKPIKDSIYLSFADKVSMTWEGGREFTLEAPSYWVNSYLKAKARWVEDSDLPEDKTLRFRFHGDRPLGNLGNVSGHAGGAVINFFTGLSIGSPPGVKCLVTHVFNSFSHIWTMQDGIYDTDLFKGDFSVNFQFLLQGKKVTFQKGEPFASLLFYKEAEEPEIKIHSLEESDERWGESLGFYRRKSLEGCPYHANIKNDQSSKD